VRYPQLALIAALSGLIGLSVLVYYIATMPTTLRIAVGPVANEHVRTVTAAIQTLQREREPFRLRLVLTEGTTQTAEALESGKADLAVVRTDIGYPRSGAAVAVLHTDHVILIAPGGGATKIDDLAGKSVGLIRDHGGNREILRIIAQQAGLAPGAITPVAVRQTDLRMALEQGRVAAALVVGPITGRQVFDVVNIVSEAGNGDITFIAVPETNAIEQRHPLVEADTIVRGSFSGPRPRPDRDTPTLTVTHQLLAAKTLNDATVADFTRVILQAKAQIAADAPLAARMEAPDQEKTSPIPIHPGTITYIDGQTSTFLERYGDWFYMGIMALGLGGSALAAWLSVRGARARDALMEELADVTGLVTAAREAPDETALAKIDAEADRIFAYTIEQTAKSNLDAASVLAFNMALTQVRDAISLRRRMLGGP
jgi:TRAP transporter TAXI family solute receptor